MTSATKWLTLACLAIAPCFSYAADTAALAKRLQNAADASSLDDPSLKPRHLKLSVQFYDAKGKPSEQGVVDEWWSPEAYKLVYTSPSYSSTEIHTGTSVYRTTGKPAAPYLLEAALRFVVHPGLPTETIEKSDLELQSQSFGKVSLDCILLSRPGKTPNSSPAGRVLTACLDPGADQLRVSWFDPEVSTRNSIGLFQGRKLAIDSSISIYAAKAISQHVEVLENKSFDASFFMPGTDLEVMTDDPVWVSPGTSTLKKLRGDNPVYPTEAKMNHISGVVMLVATIGLDGHVINTDVIGSPDPFLSRSAMTAVKSWVYTPYLINGVAARMRTTVAVHYNIERITYAHLTE